MRTIDIDCFVNGHKKIIKFVIIHTIRPLLGWLTCEKWMVLIKVVDIGDLSKVTVFAKI